MGVPYDYLSVSHYRKDQYTSGVTQIETLDKKYKDIIGTQDELSDLDVKQLALMYRCDGKIKFTETVARRCSVKKVFLKILQGLQLYLKKDSGTGVFL